MVLHMYQKETDKIDIQNTANEVITKKDSRSGPYGFLWVL